MNIESIALWTSCYDDGKKAGVTFRKFIGFNSFWEAIFKKLSGPNLFCTSDLAYTYS